MKWEKSTLIGIKMDHTNFESCIVHHLKSLETAMVSRLFVILTEN